MFTHWIALEKLHRRNHIRAISKLGVTLHHGWERCRITKTAIFSNVELFSIVKDKADALYFIRFGISAEN
jgi:hypothetical protein